MVTGVCMQVYEMAVDTILLSFCEDCMQNDESPKFAPPLLNDALGLTTSAKRTTVMPVPSVG